TIGTFPNYIPGTERVIEWASINFDGDPDDGFDFEWHLDYMVPVLMTPAGNTTAFSGNLLGSTVDLTGLEGDAVAYTALGEKVEITVGRAGIVMTIQAQNTEGVLESGDILYCGMAYERLYEPSVYVPRVDTPSGVVRLAQGRVQTRRVTVGLVEATWLEAEVTRDGEVLNSATYDNRKIGGTEGELGASRDQDSLGLDVGANSDTMKVVLTNSTPFPTKISSISWQQLYHNRSENV
ncbi:hypothetical protein N8077_04335, partial [Myxococcota bacterium]|nr:hypothetical protein [Myxococcota bacterium]